MKRKAEIMSCPKITLREEYVLNGLGSWMLTGTFRFNNGQFASIVIGNNEEGWEHVSVSPYKERKTPNWDMMCEVKDACWGDEEEVYQIHPPKSEYVNVKSNCLHLWRRADGKRLMEGERKL